MMVAHGMRGGDGGDSLMEGRRRQEHQRDMVGMDEVLGEVESCNESWVRCCGTGWILNRECRCCLALGHLGIGNLSMCLTKSLTRR